NQIESILNAVELADREQSEDANFRSSEFRLNLAYFVKQVDNLFRDVSSLANNDIASWFKDKFEDSVLPSLRKDWNEQENMIIDKFRLLREGEDFTVKRTTNGDTIVEHTSSVEINEEMRNSLSDINGGCGEFRIMMSGGKPVRAKVIKSTRL
ncbi:MAG: hypothetical protein Q4B65_01205, partial [Candidatus Saccharibacteria bacterium]|nr:hypothetical protein [Candidatus Saccharibacteria bacterium]